MREDADALDRFAEELAEELAEHADAGLSLQVAALAANPQALRQRLIRLAVAAGSSRSALALADPRRQRCLVTDWHGQEVRRPARRWGGAERGACSSSVHTRRSPMEFGDVQQ